MAGRKIRDEADARRCLAEAKASGRSRAEWCRSVGIDGRSLNLWRVNLRRRGTKQVTVRMVELIPQSASPFGSDRGFRVHSGAFTVEVPVGFDEDALARLLRVVAAC